MINLSNGVTIMKKTKTTTFVIQCILTFIVLIFAQNSSYAQIQPGSFEFDGQTRDYSVFLPQNYQPNMPVVISLHGNTQFIQNLMDYTMMNDFADTAGFIVAYPVGTGQKWSSGAADGRNLPQENDVGFISALIDTLLFNGSQSQRSLACSKPQVYMLEIKQEFMRVA
jgi:poly(3-hydroxybutyrate) depolymerase